MVISFVIGALFGLPHVDLCFSCAQTELVGAEAAMIAVVCLELTHLCYLYYIACFIRSQLVSRRSAKLVV